MNTKQKTKTKKSKSKKSKKNIKNRKPIIAIIAICLVALVALIGSIAISNNSTESEDSDQVFGIDVSEHNGSINWKKVAKQAEYAIIRTGCRTYSSGTIKQDKYIAKNLTGATKADLPVGVYFYSQAITVAEAEEEAQAVLEAIDGYDIQLPVFMDCEFATDKNDKLTGRLYEAKLTAKEQSEIINAFFDAIKKEGYDVGIYASSSFMKSNIDMSLLNKKAIVWVADYNKSLTYQGDYDIWQYSSKGEIKGIGSQYVDTNTWNKKSFKKFT